MGRWPAVRIGDLATVRSGFAFKSSDWRDSGIPVVKIANIKEGNLDMNGCSHVSFATARQSRDCRLVTGDILVAMTGYIGDTAFVRPTDLPALVNQRVGKFTIADESLLHRRFFFYALRSNAVRTAIESLGYGSAQPNVSPALIHQVTMPLPPLSEQRAIAEVLGALDDKIEANRRIVSLCWSLATAYFEAAIATSERLVPLSSLLKLDYGKALPAGARRPGTTPVYGSGGIVGQHDEPLVIGPGVIVGRKGTAGSVYWSHRAFFPIDTTFYVSHASVPMVFAYFALRSLGLDNMNSDSAVPGLNRNTAMSQLVPLPGDEDLARFRRRAEVLVDAAEATASEIYALEALRDVLLPELVSGELRVREAEAQIEEAG